MMFASCTCRRGLGYFNSFICFFAIMVTVALLSLEVVLACMVKTSSPSLLPFLQVWNTPTLITDRPQVELHVTDTLYNTSFQLILSNVDWEISRVAESEFESLQPISIHSNGSSGILI